MGQINIKTTLIFEGKTTENQMKGNLLDKKLIYEENNSLVSILIDKKSVNMVAKDEEHILDLTFKNGESTKGVYTLFRTNSCIDIDIFTKLLQIGDNCIKIIYIFNNEERTYEIEYEV